MSYWEHYPENHQPPCNQQNNMAYYNGPQRSNYNQASTSNHHQGQPYYEERTNSSNNDDNGRRRHKPWNAGKKNERYGSGRTLGRRYDTGEGDYQRQDNRNHGYHNRNKGNFRYNGKYGKSNGRNHYKGPEPKNLDAASQRERLEEMLTRRTLECLVCCEKIKHIEKIWTCKQCYHIIHLNCIIVWADSSKLESGWRCPACQHVCQEVPKLYTCYCTKTLEPRPQPGVVPHACGELCEKSRRFCPHKCTILCHPGPCPDCHVMVNKECGCGRTVQTVKCSNDIDILCDEECGKLLECGLHNCQEKCHSGGCLQCTKPLLQECFCGKVGRKVQCGGEHRGEKFYSCGEACSKVLSCGNHQCEKLCHDGACGKCDRDISSITTCPCGKSSLQQERKSCLDPIQCCDKICGNMLKCGQPAAPHTCKQKCHEGSCSECSLTTSIRCRCGHMSREIPCPDLTTAADDARCEKKCTKKRLCGKHRCNGRCCIEIEHHCPLPCNHLLSCGQHRCERTCHSGRCLPCTQTSFDELYCECGANVIYPPIMCGTRPPQCDKPCPRPRPCGHDANHECHTGSCPPCTILCKRWCYGNHEQRAAIPCYQEDFSCGLACNKMLACGKHKCDKACHRDACPSLCKQKCQIKRAQCGHICGAVCHEGACPETPCKQMVSVTCLCGLQKSSRPCIDLTDEYRDYEMAQMRDKMVDMMKDQAVDISDLAKLKKPVVLKILECTEECRVLERNRRLAIGLQIRNPDLSQKLTPRYSEFMRNWAKKDIQFCQKVHDKLTELVQLAKQSKQKSRSHSFESMNRDKRHFVHEYCEHFGCESAAYDAEPNRNVVATAFKEKSWLPSISLLEFIQRENGQRKVPGPVFTKGSMGKSETVALKVPNRIQKATAPVGETIDYFDNPPC